MKSIVTLVMLSACSDYGLFGRKDAVQVGTSEDPSTSPPVTTDSDSPTATEPTDSGTPETGTATDSGTTPTVPTEGCRSILLYSTEGQSGRDNYLGIFTLLPAALQAEGFDFEVVERATGGDLTPEMLEGRSQLWIMGTDRDFDTTPTQGEVDAAIEFVGAGGGLLLTTDHTDTVYSYTEDVNAFAEAFGVTFSGIHNESSGVSERAPESLTGPLGAGISTLPAFVSVSYLTRLDLAVQIAFELDGAPAVAWRDDGPRVVFDRTWLGWADYHLEKYDQATLVSNVAELLETCTEE